ncbi:A-kinase anchor protein 17A [Periplaneta americana]|uniref:A-kinase anchor protein 17A n=1 Tax=Periplaneta americana TaxID=6978 RepID=UPI0037E9155E
MNVFQSCNDTSDAIELFPPQSLYLKPIARLNISVQLPQMKLPGKTISNWEVMEKLKNMIKPEEFIALKVSKSTLEFIRFEAEIENKSKLSSVAARLDTRTIKLTGFSELLKIRAAEAKIPFPTRHTWDSYFRDARNMNEMKPGERPDTIHISNLPCKWFATKQDKTKGNDIPSEYLFRKVFEVFGEVRCVDIPAADPYRNKMKAHLSGMKTFSFGQDLSFEAYVQFKEYICFVKAMDALRGMKLLHKEGDKACTASIKVDFDKTKHLSDPSIRRRRIEREKIIAQEREIEERERKQQELEEQKKEEERLQKLEEKRQKAERRKKREEKRKQKQIMKMKEKEAREMNLKIAIEERKLLIAQRKLESIRLLDELFERVKANKQKELGAKKEDTTEKKVIKEKQKKDDKILKKKQDKDKINKDKLQDKERELRNKLVKKYKSVQEQQLEEQREKLLQTIEGKNKLRSVLASTSKKPDTAEQSSGSSDSSSEEDSSNSTELTSHRETSWKEKQDFDGKKYHFVSQYKDRYWYQSKHYFEDTQSYMYPYDDRGGPALHSDFFKTYHNQRFPPNMRFNHRGGFYPRRRGFYVPRWQRNSRGGQGYRNFAAQGFSSDSFYYDDVTNDYYRYFQKLAKGKRNDASDATSEDTLSSGHSRSRTFSSNSRSRSVSRTRSYSKSWSRSRSRSRTWSHKHFRSRSRSWSQRKSCSRSRSHSKTRTKSRDRSVTRSKWSDGVKTGSATVDSKNERTLRHNHSKKKKKHKRDDVCSDSDKRKCER